MNRKGWIPFPELIGPAMLAAAVLALSLVAVLPEESTEPEIAGVEQHLALDTETGPLLAVN
jgi:hypothetical protein